MGIGVDNDISVFNRKPITHSLISLTHPSQTAHTRASGGHRMFVCLADERLSPNGHWKAYDIIM